MKTSRKRYYIPLIIFIAFACGLLLSIYKHHDDLPTPFLNRVAPDIRLPSLFNEKTIISNKTWQGHLALINVWATWCVACLQEHPFLQHLAKQNQIALYGLNYKDDRLTAIDWLKKHGNPYRAVAFDNKGLAAIDWGVYGTPETYLLDADGIIRYKHVGPMNEKIWKKKFMPLIKRYQS